MSPVLQLIRGRRDDLGPAGARIADAILSDPAQASRWTIDQVAGAASCSQASIVNFARELGYGGYRAFRSALLVETARAAGTEEELTVPGDIDPADPLAASVAKIAAADARAVHDTVRLLDMDVLARAGQLLSSAGRIVLTGAGASGLAAFDLQYKLTRLGLSAQALVSVHETLPAVTALGPRDCLVAVSDSGRTEDVLDAVAIAATSAVPIIAITGSPASVLGQSSDLVLLTASREPSFRSGATSSRIAQLTIADCLLMAISSLQSDQGRDALRRTRDVLEGRRRS